MVKSTLVNADQILAFFNTDTKPMDVREIWTISGRPNDASYPLASAAL